MHLRAVRHRAKIAGIALSAFSCKEEPLHDAEDSGAPVYAGAVPQIEKQRLQNPEAPAQSQKLDAGNRMPATGCREGMARIGSFCIDRYEIVLEKSDGTRFGHNIHPPKHMSGLRAVSLEGVRPQGHLSQPQAAKACFNAGKRLCTSDEWDSACRSGGNSFPYGKTPDRTKCNVGRNKLHILDYYFPEIPHLQRRGREFNDPMLLLDPSYQTKTGQMEGCVTREGVYDLDGNMSEWVSETIARGGMVFGTFRGAPFSGGVFEGCARKTTGHAAEYYDYSTGTRCCTH